MAADLRAEQERRIGQHEILALKMQACGTGLHGPGGRQGSGLCQDFTQVFILLPEDTKGMSASRRRFRSQDGHPARGPSRVLIETFTEIFVGEHWCWRVGLDRIPCQIIQKATQARRYARQTADLLSQQKRVGAVGGRFGPKFLDRADNLPGQIAAIARGLLGANQRFSYQASAWMPSWIMRPCKPASSSGSSCSKRACSASGTSRGSRRLCSTHVSDRALMNAVLPDPQSQARIVLDTNQPCLVVHRAH